jgi:hypothetical protein
LLDEFGLSPRLAFISGKAHVRAAVDPTVLEQVKHCQFAAGEPQQRHAHHVVATDVLHDGDWGAPGVPLVVGVDLHDARGTLVRCAAVELRVTENHAAGFQCGERTFGVTWEFFGWLDVERDEALGVGTQQRESDEQNGKEAAHETGKATTRLRG